MKKNRIALILVLFTVLCYPVFSDREDCWDTQDYFLGLAYGRAIKPTWGWWLLGSGLTVMGGIVSFALFPPEYYLPQKLPLYVIAPAIGTAISIALPLAIKPKPKIIPDWLSENQLECYLDGYEFAAKAKKAGRALAGSLFVWMLAVPMFFELAAER